MCSPRTFSSLFNLLICVVLISSVCSLYCYKCDSINDPKCLISDHYLSIPVIECAQAEDACYRTDTWVNNKGQLTMKITRGCGSMSSCDYMYDLPSSRHSTCYACRNSYCNIY